MSNVDVFTICSELKELLKDSRFQKAYQPTKDTVLIRFHVPGKGRTDVIFQAGYRVHVTHYPLVNPKIPPSFPMLLRKYLKGGTVTDIRQHNFDRILELDIQKEHKYSLVIEIFAKGNIILLDEEGRIILPLKRKLWEDRRITSKEPYKYPPERGINPLKVKIEDLRNLFKESDRDVIRTLARSGLGKVYAEEVILRAGVNKSKPAPDLNEEEIETIYQALRDVFSPLLRGDFKPQIVTDGEADVLPLELKIYQKYEKKTFKSYNEAADEFYSSIVGEKIKETEEDIWEAEVEKYRKRLRIQEETLEKFLKTVEESKIKGDLLYSNYQEVQKILDTIIQARESHSWQEIISIIKKAKKKGLKGLETVESIDKMGKINLKLEDKTINIDSKLSIPENAEIYYNKGKKAKKKIRGVKIAIEKTLTEIERAENQRNKVLEKVLVPQRRVKKELKWFEKLRWFLSSDGFLVVGGRDATTNELLVKRHLESQDIYLHSEIHGAPSVIIKSGGSEIPETTIVEAAYMAASFSSAWSKGYGSQDVYWVYPEQVSKTPQSGEYVAKGAFIIRGHKNFIRGVPLQIAVGLVDYQGMRIMAGPISALKKYTNNYLVIKPGYTKKEEISRTILRKIDPEHILTLEDVIRVLPSGKCDFVEKKEFKRF